MESATLSEYQKICRICLKNDILVSIYSPTFLIRPIEMLEKLHILKTPLDDNLPALLCQSCLYRLLDAYNLQQLAEASERRLRDYYCLPPLSFTTSSAINCGELQNSDLTKVDTDCSSGSMYANICDIFDRHDVTNDMVEVVGTDDVELLNDVEIDVSSLTRSEAEDVSLSNAFITTKTKISFGAHILTKNLESIKFQQQQDFALGFTKNKTEKQLAVVKKPQRNTTQVLKKSSKTSDKCLECGKIFHYKGYLEIHKRVHSGEKPYKCQICAHQFITSNKLLLHQRTHITNNADKRFQCEVCSTFFTTSSNLKSHKFTHINQREYQCKHCLATFKSPRDLTRHELGHKEIRDIHCTICGKSFTKRTSLNAHMITVHLRIRKHKCTDCDKIFGKRSNLINHMRIHTGEKPYECRLCAWKFAQSSALKTHMKKHTKSPSTHKEDISL